MRTIILTICLLGVSGCVKTEPIETYSFTTVPNHTLRGIKDPNFNNITKKECLAYVYLIEMLEDRVTTLEKKQPASSESGS